MTERKSISDLIVEYFKAHPYEELSHGPVVDWVTEEYRRLYNRTPRDIWRGIRNLHQKSFLIKVRKGIYKYDPSHVHSIEAWDFPMDIKRAIFKRDNYRCVVCGRGENSGVEIHADHIKSRDRGGGNTVENGQTLCGEHNYLKKNYSQTEAGKRYFIKLYEDARIAGDKRITQFCKSIFNTYNNFDINRHIARPNDSS